jgi:hypothetical protein
MHPETLPAFDATKIFVQSVLVLSLGLAGVFLIAWAEDSYPQPTTMTAQVQ